MTKDTKVMLAAIATAGAVGLGIIASLGVDNNQGGPDAGAIEAQPAIKDCAAMGLSDCGGTCDRVCP